jgi:hypothetical protein
MSRTLASQLLLLGGLLSAFAGCDLDDRTGPGAEAGCTPAATINGSPFQGGAWSYDYSVCDVADIDQRKDAVPQQNIAGLASGGICYCVPTSTLNWLSYIARNGYGQLRPGVSDFQLGPPEHTETYNLITAHQALLGGAAYMNLDPGPEAQTGGCGVGPDDAVPAIQQWLADDGLGSAFSVIYVGADSATGYVPRLSDAALQALFGGYVMLRVGWYADTLGAGSLTRVGGHVVSLVHARGPDNVFGAFSRVGVHDPSTRVGATTTTQSAFVRDVYLAGDDTESYVEDGGTQVRTQTRIFEWRAGQGRIDGFYAIMPKYAFADAVDGGVDLLRPVSAGTTLPPAQTRLLSGTTPILDLALLPHRTLQPFVVEGGEEILAVDVLTGGVVTFARQAGVRRLAFGGLAERLYALRPGELLALDRGGRVVANAAVRGAPGELAFDRATGRVVLLDAEQGILHFYTHELEAAGELQLPGWEARQAALTVEPHSGDIWVLATGTSTATRVTADGTSTTILVGERPLAGLHAGDDGRLYASVEGQIASFRLDGAPAGDTPFDGRPAHRWIRMMHSWTNIRPGAETGPGWNDVLPED